MRLVIVGLLFVFVGVVCFLIGVLLGHDVLTGTLKTDPPKNVGTICILNDDDGPYLFLVPDIPPKDFADFDEVALSVNIIKPQD